MISRFFLNIHFRRLLCCLLALLTLGCCLSPAFVQPAKAVAVADDVLIASLALLATSWAGITFATNAGVNSGISNLMQSKPAVKLSLAGLLTKNLVVEGTKLLLTRDVRDVFETVLPEIKSFFQTESDHVVSSGGGSLVDSVVVGSSFPVTSFSSLYDDRVPHSFNLESFIGCVFMATDPSRGTRYYRVDSDYVRQIEFSNGKWVVKDNLLDLRDGGALFKFEFFRPKGKSTEFFFSVHYNHYNDVAYTIFKDCTSPQISLVSATASSPYYTSKEVDGTQIQEITWGVQFVPDPNDPTEPTNPDDGNKRIPVWPLGPVQAPFDPNISQDAANQDPGLSPEEMIAELKKLLEAQQTGGGDSGTTNPNPNPNPDPDPGPDAPGGADVPPNFNQMMTPNLKDFFPFCIPGDIKKMIDALCAAPEAPKFTFATSFMGQVYSVNIDLSPWDGVATSVRYMVVAVYIAALAVATRKFIKW